MLTDGSNDSLEPLWNDGEFVVSRATHTIGRGPMLVVTPVLAQPVPASLARLEHAYALRDGCRCFWCYTRGLVYSGGFPAPVTTPCGRPATRVHERDLDCRGRACGSALR